MDVDEIRLRETLQTLGYAHQIATVQAILILVDAVREFTSLYEYVHDVNR